MSVMHNAPGCWQRCKSRGVLTYFRHAPIAVGKWRLLKLAASFLIVQLEDGPWMRVTGVSGLEWELMNEQPKEPKTMEVFRSLVKPGMVILDVGASVGYFSLIAASHTGPTGKVIAFEPTPAVFARLQENIALNSFKTITAVNTAVGDVSGTTSFFVNPTADDSEGNSLFAKNVVPGSTKITVQVTTLDEVVSQLGLHKIDVLKIDVEGNDVRVLRGAHRTLSGAHPLKLLIEVNPLTLEAAGFTADAVYQELKALGYSWKVIEEIPWKGSVTRNILAQREGSAA